MSNYYKTRKIVMKTKNVFNQMILVFSFSFIFFTSNLLAQWQTQSPYPTFLDVRGVGAPTADRVFIATEDNSFDNGGALFESTDGGNTWTQRNVPISLFDGFNGLYFLDSQHGWAFGNDNYRTTDGGTNWTQLPFLGSTYFMKFYTTMFGLATGNFDKFISRDGGDTWVESPNGIFGFDFFDTQIALGVSSTGFYRTTDGGNNFTSVFTGNAESVVFLSEVIAIGISDDSIIRSTDGGLTWNSIVSANGRTKLQSVSSDVVIAWGRTGAWPNYDDRILRSSDGGQTWTDLGEVIPEGIDALTTVDLQTIVAVDQSGNMFRSSDAGLNWTQTFVSRGQLPSFFNSAAPYFADTQVGYFGYGTGFVIKTTDAGASWFQVSSGTGETLNDVDRLPNGNMISVGDNGTLISSNGISQWIVQERFTQQNLKAVQVLNSNEVFVADMTGQIYKSNDGGLTWIPAADKPSNMSEAEDIHFTTSLDGWIIGQSFNTGALYHTTNGGATWTPVTDFLGAYKSVDVEGTNIWAANVGEIFYRSTDNGATWIQGELPWSPVQIGDMDFYNESIGYAVGWWGQVFRTTDGGINWEIINTPTTDHNFTDVYLLGVNELWISTNSDVAYYTATGGQSWSVMNIESEGFGIFSSIVAVPNGDAWTVGSQGYIERFIGPPPPPANILPIADFDFTANGLTINFTDLSTDPDGFIVSWDWNFGDGNNATQQNPTHTFDTANTYIVSLTVTDNDGGTGSFGRIIVVQPGPGGTFGDFTEVTPLDSLFFTPQDEDFWVVTTAPADYDNDGDIDIAVLGFYVVYNVSAVDRLVLIRNEGELSQTEWDFSYIDLPIGTMTSSASDLAWGDVDNDTDLDLVVGTDGVTVLYKNNAGNLELTDTELPGYWEENSQADFDLRSITWADYDNDGDLDLLIPSVWVDSAFSYQTVLMRNEGPNTTGGWIFTETDSIFSSTSHAQTAWADFDNDQDLDLLLINIAPLFDEGFIRRYRNDGNGVFVGEDILGTLSVEHGEAQWGDYDGDGDLDILVAGNVKETNGTYTHMALRIYRNDNENFVPEDVIPCIPCDGWFDLTAATWADYDSDGDMDILLAGNHNPGTGNIEGRAIVYTNENGVFTKSDNELPAPRSMGDRGGTFSWFDLDGEGDLDYFIAGTYFVPGGNGLDEAQMHVYRNDTPAQNEAPTSPTGLTADKVSPNTVLLSWQPAIDDNTPGPAITYDIVIIRRGTHVPHKPNNTIITRLPEPGNISAVNEWLITGLPDGIYDWKIRAVDAAYIGGPIATGEFLMGVTSADDDENNLPDEYSLEQNYPNPFNPVTIIKYALPEEALVTLKVYNIIGEEIATLIDEVKQPGNYSLKFDAANLPSGAYFYRMQGGNFTQVRKMIITK
jgi:photosystem II stability/assembly factor-like uncharacterized protein